MSREEWDEKICGPALDKLLEWANGAKVIEPVPPLDSKYDGDFCTLEEWFANPRYKDAA